MKGKNQQQQNNYSVNNDIFDAMDRLSRMIDSDKKHLSATPEESPERESPPPLKERTNAGKYNVQSFHEVNIFYEIAIISPTLLT